VNPDASLFFFAVGDSDVGERRGPGVPGDWPDSVARLPAGTDGAPHERSEDCNTDCPGRSGYTAPPDNDTEHRGTTAHCTPSATPADEGWMKTHASEKLPRGPCLARFGGAVSERLWWSEPVPRPSQRLERSKPFSRACHLPSIERRLPSGLPVLLFIQPRRFTALVGDVLHHSPDKRRFFPPSTEAAAGRAQAAGRGTTTV
jgi:hypothetical protein